MQTRLDILLVQRGLTSGREKAKEIIKSGQVFVGGKLCQKASACFDEEINIEIHGETLKYVGRGGLKLEKAISAFEIDLKDKVCADIGASTGGFTDCMLQNGAKKVYAVDVGHGQLADKLLSDNRVISLEGVNVRYLTSEEIPESVDFISIDVSFISLKLVVPKLLEFLCDDGYVVALIKPQFEVGKSEVGKNGIVKSKKAHISAIESLIAFFENSGLEIKDITFSPITGSDGNIEYLVYMKKSINNSASFINKINITNYVTQVFNEIKNNQPG